jgi:hypothetical protein
LVIQDVTESGNLATVFFPWIGWSGEDANTDTQQPTSKRFSCKGAVDWGTTCICCESVLQKWLQFMIIQREFGREFGIHRNRAVPSALAIKTWVRNFEATGSTPKKKGGGVKQYAQPRM